MLLGDHVVGIAFQCLTSGENIGYIIPVPVINHFLEDLERNGKYTGGCVCVWGEGGTWRGIANTQVGQGMAQEGAQDGC